MTEVKQCKQCGALKPAAQFRKYYGGRTGTYNQCRSCEKINSREKYLARKARSGEEEYELKNIHQLWEMQRAQGLQPPRTADKAKSVGVMELVNEQLTGAHAQTGRMAEAMLYQEAFGTNEGKPIPVELQEWLTKELVEEPEYYQDEVYEKLRAKYRPVLHIDAQRLVPVYDDTYIKVLNTILDRFNTYEDEYWG